MGQKLENVWMNSVRPNLLKSEAGVIGAGGKYSVYYEYHKNDEATKTAIMVNGALATTTAFTPWVRNLRDHINVVLFDLPFCGKSREHNVGDSVVTKEDEVEILLDLIETFNADYLMSVSWGGVSSLMSLARRPASIEKAVITSFSPIINDAMYNYMVRARRYLCDQDISGAAQLLNSTVGKYLPRLLKAHNYEYLLSMLDGNERQILFHINQIFELDHNQYADRFADIEVPVLFINGGMDEYTTAGDAQLLAQHIKNCHFAVIPEAGHFLDLESAKTRRICGEIMRGFLLGTDTVGQAMHVNEMAN